MPEQFNLKLVKSGCPIVATLFEHDRSIILVRIYQKRIIAASPAWGMGAHFCVNKFGVGIFADHQKRWISGEPFGFDHLRENALRDELRRLAGAKIERFDRNDPVYRYGATEAAAA